jgi:hypothetical protein
MQRFKEVVCADGFSMSVQASETHYCSPREDGAEKYTAVEVGYPCLPEPLLTYLAEDQDAPTMTVYPFVPAQLVALVIAKHGGMVSGELPPGVAPLQAVDE